MTSRISGAGEVGLFNHIPQGAALDREIVEIQSQIQRPAHEAAGLLKTMRITAPEPSSPREQRLSSHAAGRGRPNGNATSVSQPGLPLFQTAATEILRFREPNCRTIKTVRHQFDCEGRSIWLLSI
jgi:hypothetical protein